MKIIKFLTSLGKKKKKSDMIITVLQPLIHFYRQHIDCIQLLLAIFMISGTFINIMSSSRLFRVVVYTHDQVISNARSKENMFLGQNVALSYAVYSYYKNAGQETELKLYI